MSNNRKIIPEPVPEPRGTYIENITSEFCTRPFLLDFIYLRPKLMHNNRELCDLLVILDNNCLCIQIKAHGTDISISEPNAIGWALKHFGLAGRQASGAIRKISTSGVLTNHPWRGEICFSPGSTIPIGGLALVEYIGPPFTLQSNITLQGREGIPIHYLTLNDFFNVVDILGTLPDVIEYFRQRGEISEDIRNVVGIERDIIGTYLTDGHLRPRLGLQEIKGRWASIDSISEALDRKNRHDIFVSFFNRIIDELHKRDSEQSTYVPPEFAEYSKPDTENTRYLEIASRLNKLPYTYRREIGMKLFQTAKAVKEDGKARTFSYRDLGQPWPLVFHVTSNIDRTTRIRQLNLAVARLNVEFGYQSVIGIACPSLDSNQGYDCIFIDKVTYDRDAIEKMAPKIIKTSIVNVPLFPDKANDSSLPIDQDFK